MNRSNTVSSLAKLLLMAALLSITAACIRPYQPNIQQGNILNNNNLKELRQGMSKQEVLYILGTPMVIDPFNEQRWDYYYYYKDYDRGATNSRIIPAW